ncbi:MAG: N-acetyltransferase family protein [Halolamina sp.]
MRVRQARAGDADAVAAFTRDTWSGRDQDDYMPETFPEWVATDGPRQHTLVADPEDGSGDVAGVLQCVLLSEHEGWAQGMRVNPAYRGRGVSVRLVHALFEWAADAGATVVRNMVFSWNVAGLGQSRAVGYEPCTEFRWAMPTPAADTEARTDRAVAVADPEPDAAWSFWADSAAREHLAGLALDDEEAWALSELTRDRVREAGADDRLLAVAGDTDHTRAASGASAAGRPSVTGLALRNRTYEREADEADESDDRNDEDVAVVRWAEYAVGAWADGDAADALLAAVARDAAAVGADRTRVLIPESVRWVSDVAAARCAVSDEPDFVLAADTADPTG